MSLTFGPVKVYQHDSYVRRIIVHPDQARCITVGRVGVKMFSLRSNRHLMDFANLSESHIRDAALVNNETLAAILGSRELCFYSLANGKIVRRFGHRSLEDISGYERIASLSGEHFMVTGKQRRINRYRSKAVLLDLETNSTIDGPEDIMENAVNVVATCTSFGGDFDEVAAYQNRFVTGGPDKSAQVWAVRSRQFRRLKVLRPGYFVGAVSLDEKHIFVAHAKGVDISIYNANTFELIRVIVLSVHVPEVLSISSDWLLFAYSWRAKSILALDIRHGTELWRMECNRKIHYIDMSITDEPQVIVATAHRQVLTCRLPDDIAREFKKSGNILQSEHLPLPPLQAALATCLSGRSSPRDYCNTLIKYELCRESFAEWCSAHHILTLAVQNGDVNNSTEHERSLSHWFESLYLAVKDVELTSEEDYLMAKLYLKEAKQMGLIESTDAVLAALHVTKALNEEVRELQRAGILIFEQALRIEKRLDHLQESCALYRKLQLYSQCIGIALQIIPLVGGVSAGVVSAGVNIVEGLSIKDVADYAFGLGGSVAEGGISSLGDRVIYAAANALQPESTAKLGQEQIHALDEAVSACGLNVEKLRDHFIERSFASTSGLGVATSIMAENEGGPCTTPAIRRISSAPVLPEPALSYVPEVLVAEEVRDFSTRSPSELKSVELSRTLIEQLEHIEIAELLAAYIVRFDDTEIDSYLSLRDRIYHVMKVNYLDGEVLVNREEAPLNELVKTIVEGLNCDGKSEKEIPLGVKAKLKLFLKSIC